MARYELQKTHVPGLMTDLIEYLEKPSQHAKSNMRAKRQVKDEADEVESIHVLKMFKVVHVFNFIKNK